YDFTWTEVNGDFKDDSTITVDFYEQPEADAGQGGDTCGQTFELHAKYSVTNASGYWQQTEGPGIPDWGNRESNNTSVKVDQYGTYEFTWTETNGTCSDNESISVTFKEPAVADAGEDVTIDEGDSVQLNASGGQDYSWSPSEGLSDPTAPDPVAEPRTTTTYTVTVTNEAGCTDTDEITITVNPAEFAQAGPDTAICRGGTAQLQASGGVSYHWKPSIGLSDPETENPEASPEQTTTYQVFVVNEKGLEDSAEVTVTVNPLPELSIQDQYEICEGDTVRLNAEGAGDFEWYPKENMNRYDIPDPLAYPENTTTYRVDLTNEYQCSRSKEVTIQVYQKPEADAGEDQTLNYQFETILDANRPVEGNGEWSVVEGNAVFEDITDPKTKVTDLELKENILQWSVDNGVCPVAEDQVSITVKDINPPTVITPNQDNKNDYFRIPGMEKTEYEEFIVFDKWGNEVFREKNYQEDWDGRNHQGDKLMPDTYFYILKLKSGRVLKGFINIEE
ncbi:MAG: gliding motility-associated C-terminal domain-containing protein, partial [Bacteroidales bacterium]